MFYLIIIIVVFLFIYYSEFNTRLINGFYVKQPDSVKTFTEIDNRIKKFRVFLKKKYGECLDNYCKRIIQLENNYNSNNLYEISPHNIMGNTSFTQQKSKMVFCIRNKNNEIHDINTIMFVVLHELSHLMHDKWGHGESFWFLFKKVLEDAVEAGIYKPVDYSKYPQNYCGMTITQNPYF